MSPLEEIRHSTAHILATAVLRLYPETKLDIGPPTDSGFYYDFDSEISFTPEILVEIEQEMAKVIKENQRFERMEVSRKEAKEIIRKMDQEEYKLGRSPTFPKAKLFPSIETGNLWTYVQAHMFPIRKKLKPLSYCKPQGPITVEMLPINNCKEFTALPLPPKMNWQNILNRSKKRKKRSSNFGKRTGTFSHR